MMLLWPSGLGWDAQTHNWGFVSKRCFPFTFLLKNFNLWTFLKLFNFLVNKRSEIFWISCKVQSHSAPLPSDPDVWARETEAEDQRVVGGLLEHHWPGGHLGLPAGFTAAAAERTLHGLRTCHLLCRHHLLVHPSPRHLWSQQVPGTLRHDDRQNGTTSPSDITDN